MIRRDDFEHRLGQGLRRWAGAGQPTMDLEAFVKERLGQQAPSSPVGTKVIRSASRSRRWLAGAAAVATMMLVVWASFPAWAGAAARLPLVGPVVTELIMKDAGLKWAYDAGLIQETVAEVTEGNVTVRILGAVADRTRTTVIYQITGWQEPERSGKPLQAGRLGALTHPVAHPPSVSISTVAGQGVGSWSHQPIMTPVGLVGMVSTLPLAEEAAPVQLTVRIDDKSVLIDFHLTRTDDGAHETLLGQSQTIGGITVTVDAVIHTPVETVVRYTTRRASFSGSYGWSDNTLTPYLEQNGKQQLQMHSHGTWHHTDELTQHAVFPASDGPVKLVIPADVQGAPANLVWKLEPGYQQEMAGAAITLTEWQRNGEQVAFAWQFPSSGELKGFSGLDVIDAYGVAHPIQITSSSRGSSTTGPERVTVEAILPAQITPVAIRSSEVGLMVMGPWVFELP